MHLKNVTAIQAKICIPDETASASAVCGCPTSPTHPPGVPRPKTLPTSPAPKTPAHASSTALRATDYRRQVEAAHPCPPGDPTVSAQPQSTVCAQHNFPLHPCPPGPSPCMCPALTTPLRPSPCCPTTHVPLAGGSGAPMPTRGSRWCQTALAPRWWRGWGCPQAACGEPSLQVGQQSTAVNIQILLPYCLNHHRDICF